MHEASETVQVDGGHYALDKPTFGSKANEVSLHTVRARVYHMIRVLRADPDISVIHNRPETTSKISSLGWLLIPTNVEEIFNLHPFSHWWSDTLRCHEIWMKMNSEYSTTKFVQPNHIFCEENDFAEWYSVGEWKQKLTTMDGYLNTATTNPSSTCNRSWQRVYTNLMPEIITHR